ncbi:asparaginase [Synechococcus sp. PCC 7336]|uniref:asparaginase n=1 Tax=Synechococcus sp. PCC 7336 TaxID=195250 RepID=UPI00034BEE62|nr:asparaginase [Synechococcus sp. PCC 7336]
MDLERRTSSPSITVHLLREGIPESAHTAWAAVADARGRLLSVAGNGDSISFIRSSFKPFQALAALSSGAQERFELTDKDLAIMCGSHRGSMSHVRQVFSMLWRADLEAESLMCPVPKGQKSALFHNCSGKHAGFLMCCRIQGWSLLDYLDRNHPVQKLVRSHLSDLLKMPAEELLMARDDCGAPTYQLQLGQMATLYAQLSAGDRFDLETLTRAMIHQPEMVAGPGAFDTELMKVAGGELVSKSGAEGVQCVGRVGEGMGLAIKVADGSSRAKYAIALHLLRQLGWLSPATAEDLVEQFCQVGPYTRLQVDGNIRLS